MRDPAAQVATVPAHGGQYLQKTSLMYLMGVNHVMEVKPP